jgi:hypothetical protein
MPVTIKPTQNRAREARLDQVSTGKQLLHRSCEDEYFKCARIIRSSFDHADLSGVASSKNGFVYACIFAYSTHHHLAIRPDDVWFAILSQLGLYIDGNAEELRSIFVSHEGQKDLMVESSWEDFPEKIIREMAKDMNESDLPEWIKPDFSTTTKDDITVACIFMMGAMQKYFSYTMTFCGLPSVTLLGERNDWQRLFEKVDRLVDMSEQAATFHSLLKPVLGYFVRSFDEPGAAEVVSFWNRIVHWKDRGSGPAVLSGWLTAFCFWDREGKMMYRTPPMGEHGCNLDGTLYHHVSENNIPAGYMGVPMKHTDMPEKEFRLVAGSVGIRCTSSGELMDMSSPWQSTPDLQTGNAIKEIAGLDSLQPFSGWWIYELSPEAINQAEKRKKDELAWEEMEAEWEETSRKRKKELEKDEHMPAKNEKTVIGQRVKRESIEITTLKSRTSIESLC